MNGVERLILAGVCLATAVGMPYLRPLVGGGDVPGPVSPSGPADVRGEYAAAFAAGREPNGVAVARGEQSAAATEARVLFAEAAAALRYDGSRVAPYYQTAAQVDEFLTNMKGYFLRERRFGDRFPAFARLVAAELKAAAGEDLHGPLDREKFATALERIAAGCADAERRL